MSVTLSITETQVFTSLRTVLLTFGLAPLNPNTRFEIIRGQVNRVPEPAGPDFLVMWPALRERLSMNVETCTDNQVSASIAGSVMTVGEVLAGYVPLGASLWQLNNAASVGTILSQISGIAGGAGRYQLAPTPDLGSQTFYCGNRAMQEDVELTIQCDVHGPASADNASKIEVQWRSQWGVDACQNAGGIISPLYSSAPRQLAFDNAEQQYEERWSIDLCMQISPVVSVPQQFATKATVTAESVQTMAS